MSAKEELESKFSSLISLRKSTRTFITKKYNERDSFYALDRDKLSALLQNFQSRMDRLDSLNEQCLNLYIQVKPVSEQKVDDEVDICDQYQEKASECISLIKGLILLENKGDDMPTTQAVAYQSRSFLKPPQTPLPFFEGKDTEDISRFISEFEKAIQPYHYTDYDKFLLLKKQSQGKAGSLLGSLSGAKQTYQEAKTLLEQAFGDKQMQKFTLLTKLTSLSLKSKDPYELYSEFSSITSSLQDLSLSVDDLFKCCLWKALPHEYQTSYLAYSTDSIPNLSLLKEHFFDVCRRIQSNGTQPQIKEKEKPLCKPKENKLPANLTLAMGVETPQKGSNDSKLNKGFKPNQPHCSLCYRTGKSYSHKLGLCKNYPTAQDKVNQLKAVGGCTRCTSLKHNTSNCNYQGDKCKNCQGLHHNILCLSHKSGGGEISSSSSSSSSNSKSENKK